LRPIVTALSVLILLQASCAPALVSKYSKEFPIIDEHLRNGDTASARHSLDKIYQNGTSTERAQAGLMRCELVALESGTDSPAARLCYEQYAKELESNLQSPVRADLYALALYRFYAEQPLERRLLGFMRLSLECPGTPAGLKAINYLKGYWSSLPAGERMKAWQGWDQRTYQEKVARCSPDNNSTQVVAIVALERAKAYLELDKPQEALRVFESVWPALDQSVWWDDVAIVRADAYRLAGNPEKSLSVLELFILRRESSFFIGSYESIFFDEAMMMRGKILSSMGKRPEARQAYLDLITKAPESRLCDDAAYLSALLAEGTRQIKELEIFLKKYPESRWVRQAQSVIKR
jgi:tetratricopeptide (TPR) repeat protein